jgi:hypothetical protein
MTILQVRKRLREPERPETPSSLLKNPRSAPVKEWDIFEPKVLLLPPSKIYLFCAELKVFRAPAGSLLQAGS